jgi:aminoglycoside phosphotransferase (APT) family kinase protein
MLALTTLGEKLGAGGTAELYVYDEGHVVKLYWQGASLNAAEREASRAAAARRAGAPCPAVRKVVLIDERPGVVFERVNGASVLKRLTAEPSAYERLAQQLAELHAAIHQCGGADLPPQREPLLRRISLGTLPVRMKGPALEAARKLPQGSALCHGDFHPGNVLLSREGALAIDWFDAACGEPAGDRARTSLIIRYGKPTGEPGPPGALRTAFVDAYLAHYAQLRQTTFDALADWLLPVAAARLAEPIGAGERGALLRLIETLLAAA